MRTLATETKDKIGQSVELSGWVATRRDHGQLIFIDLRDASGLVQVVFSPRHNDAHHLAETIRSEWVIKVIGTVSSRPEAMINEELETGRVEIQAEQLEVLNSSETPPIDITGDGYDIGEESRLTYRYLDLRRPRLINNLRHRHQVLQTIRNWLTKQNFIEVETPILSKSTPEGARDYLVPYRQEFGKFYALPQAPQQYKQLLMIAGLERYFQIARCFRDEDTRGDRQPEFTQLDLEMSFVEREDVMSLNEKLLIHLVETLYPEKIIQDKPFPILSYEEVISKYGTDRPDLRRDKKNPDLLAFAWVVDFPFFEKNDSGGWTFTHNPFSAPKPEQMDQLISQREVDKIITTQYDIVLNGYEIGGGSIRNHHPKALKAVLEIIGLSEEEINNNFKHMLTALRYGAPPHGGIAWGFDRLMMILEKEPNIREVNAFPKTGDGRDPLMDSPSFVSQKQLDELGLKIIKSDNRN